MDKKKMNITDNTQPTSLTQRQDLNKMALSIIGILPILYDTFTIFNSSGLKAS